MQVIVLGKTVQILENKIAVYGLNEKDDLEEAGVFNAVLGVNKRLAERIHRIARKIRDTARPVIAKLFDYDEKNECLSKMLQVLYLGIPGGHKAEAQKAMGLRRTGDEPKPICDKIKVGNQLCLWDDAQNKRVFAGTLQVSARSRDN